jgi:hypothetical protein
MCVKLLNITKNTIQVIKMEFYRIDALCVPRENGVLTHAKFLT